MRKGHGTVSDMFKVKKKRLKRRGKRRLKGEEGIRTRESSEDQRQLRRR